MTDNWLTLIMVIVAIGSILANLSITALCFKLYTEYFKDVSIKRRSGGDK